MFLANTKPFFDERDVTLQKFNLLDFGQIDDYSYVYDPDSRVEKYLRASMPSLPSEFQMSGHGTKSRESCGKFKGIRATKEQPLQTSELMFDTCNKLSCPTCVRKASAVKATKITQKCKDYIIYCFLQGIQFPNLAPKHYSFDPLDFCPDFQDMKTYYKSIKEFIINNIEPYLDGGVVFYHHHRFVPGTDATELYEFGHFHVIGFGYLPHYKDYEKKHGFQYHFHGYLNSLADIFRVARYELTHVVYPERNIQRKSKLTDYEREQLVKDREYLTFLGGVPNPIGEWKITKSKHAYHSYFYFGNLSPYRIKKVRTFKTIQAMRHPDTNQRIYQILEGVHFKLPTIDNRYKYYPLKEMYLLKPLVHPDIQIKIFKSRLKWGKLYRDTKKINYILVKNFKSYFVE